jgi:hypothetical protein
MKAGILREIERINVVILCLGSLLTLFLSSQFNYFLSFALGSAIMSLNFRILKGIVEKSLLSQNIERKGLLIKLPLKFLGLLALISLVLIYGNVHPIYFLLGLSTVLLSIIFVQIPSVKIFFQGGEKKNGA